MKIDFGEYEKYLADLAKAKKMNEEDIKTKLKSCGLPGTSGTTVSRLKTQYSQKFIYLSKFSIPPDYLKNSRIDNISYTKNTFKPF